MQIASIYKAMSDETRLRLLHALSISSLNVQELQKIIGIPQSNVSHHLKTLQRVGLIDHKNQGTWKFYSLSSADTVSSSVASNFISIAKEGLNGFGPTLNKDRAAVAEMLENRRTESKSYFDRVASEWHDLRDSIVDSRTYLNEIKSEINSKGTFVELGCGSGILLTQLMPRTGNTIGVDYSPAMLAEAKQNLSKFNVDLRLGYLEYLPITDSSAEVALAHMVLHHVQNPIDALHEAFRIINTGGKLIIVDLVEHEDERLREVFSHRWLGFDTTELVKITQKAGFSSTKVKLLDKGKKVFMLTATK